MEEKKDIGRKIAEFAKGICPDKKLRAKATRYAWNLLSIEAKDSSEPEVKETQKDLSEENNEEPSEPDTELPEMPTEPNLPE